MAHTRSAAEGAGARNLFGEPAEHAPRPTAGGGRRHGRGRVVPLDEQVGTASGTARFTRTIGGPGALLEVARQRATRADRSARQLGRRIASQPYGALIAFVAVAALLLASSWLGLSLRAAASEHDATRADARAETRTLISQRDRARRAAATARAEELRAQRTADSWRAYARRLQRQLADARETGKHAKRKR